MKYTIDIRVLDDKDIHSYPTLYPIYYDEKNNECILGLTVLPDTPIEKALEKINVNKMLINELTDNDIPDIINRYHNLEQEKDRKRTEQSFFVTKEEIVSNGYDLSINKYKEVVYEKVEYPPTEEILQEIFNLQEQISKELIDLKNLLNK